MFVGRSSFVTCPVFSTLEKKEPRKPKHYSTSYDHFQLALGLALSFELK